MEDTTDLYMNLGKKQKQARKCRADEIGPVPGFEGTGGMKFTRPPK